MLLRALLLLAWLLGALLLLVRLLPLLCRILFAGWLVAGAFLVLPDVVLRFDLCDQRFALLHLLLNRVTGCGRIEHLARDHRRDTHLHGERLHWSGFGPIVLLGFVRLLATLLLGTLSLGTLLLGRLRVVLCGGLRGLRL